MKTLVSTARIDSLKYDYDELGNRRRAYLDTTNQSGARKIIDDWYKYDLEGRVLISEGFRNAENQVVAGVLSSTASKGTAISYDAAGRRLSSESGIPTDFGYAYERMEYGYNDLGQLLSIKERSIIRTIDSQGKSDTLDTPYFVDPNARFRSSFLYADNGNRTSQTEYVESNTIKTTTTYSYRGDGKLTSQLSYTVTDGVKALSQANYFNENGMINAAGNQVAYRYTVYNSGGNSLSYSGNYKTTHALYDDYKESITDATWTKAGSPGKTTLTYSDRGELLKAVGTGGAPFVRSFASNREGQLIGRYLDNSGRAQSYLYYQGAALANVGNISTPEISDTFEPISADDPGNIPTSYVVNTGDTLEGIAQTVWGDSRMWYLIADANGLDPSVALIAGDSLKIPNVVSSTHNNATTFKPYDPSDVIGNTTPSPKPPKPKKKKCKGVASVVMVVVAVVAAVFTAGAAIAAIGAMGAAGATAGTVAAAALGGGMTAIAGGVVAGGLGATLAGGFIGGAVGSALGQLAGKAMGVVDSFSWKQVAVGGITGGITAGLGAAVQAAQAGRLGGWAETAAEAFKNGRYAQPLTYTAQGVASYASSQVANRIVGLDTTFSWSGLAASVAGANIGGYVGGSTGIGGLPGAMIKGQISAHASAAMNDKWFGGSRPDYGQVAADAFGNTLGNWAVGKIQASEADQLAQEQAKLDRWTEGELARAGARTAERLPAAVAFAAAPNAPLTVTTASSDMVSQPYDARWMEGAPFGNNWNPELDLSSLSGYVPPIAGQRDEDVPYVGSDPALQAREASSPGLGLLDRVSNYIDDHAFIQREPLNGDFIHDNLAAVSNFANTPLNLVGSAFGLIDDGLSWRGGAGYQVLNAFPASGVAGGLVKEAALGMRGLQALRAEARITGALAPNNTELGRILSQHTAVNPGSLTDDLAGTFTGGKYSVVELSEDTVLYRAGTANQPLGQFFSQELPTSVLQTRVDKAILPVWSGGGTSPIDTVFAVKIPANTKVYVGEVGYQSGFYLGGTPQIVVVKPWAIEGVEIIKASTMK